MVPAHHRRFCTGEHGRAGGVQNAICIARHVDLPNRAGHGDGWR